ncbi:hypothetical protein KR038_011120, partial [Drosophila bunnanda]
LIDIRLSFREHFEYARKKAYGTAGRLARILLNTRRPKQITRKLLTSVSTSQILCYSAYPLSIFDTVGIQYMCILQYRLFAVRVASAFRTVSSDTVLMIARIVPLRELVSEKADMRSALRGLERPGGSANAELKSAARRWSYGSWQAKWDASSKVRWTNRLVPKIEGWIERKHGQVDFNLTQVQIGHGCFRSYLNKFAHDDEE